MVHQIWYIFCENWSGAILHFVFCACFIKNTQFLYLENGKWLIFTKKLETLFGNIVCNDKMHSGTKFGHIILNYAMNMAIT